MTHQFADPTFTDSVRSTQAQHGSREQNEHLQNNVGPNDQLTEQEAYFIVAFTTQLTTLGLN